MLTLCVDTSYKYLSCALIKDNQILASHDEICFKKQSERLFVVLHEMLIETNKLLLDIDSVCITNGPGSYTGVRIAMTMAKTIASIRKLRLFTISTLQLYAANRPNTMVLMDARAGRAYYGIYNKRAVIQADSVTSIANIHTDGYTLVGDASLCGGVDNMPSVSEAFLLCQKNWEEVADIDHLVPRYLKESDDYMR